MNPTDQIRNFLKGLLNRRRDKKPFADDSLLALNICKSFREHALAVSERPGLLLCRVLAKQAK